MSSWSIAYYVYTLSALGFLSVLILSVHRLMWLGYVGQALMAMIYVAALDGDLQALLEIDTRWRAVAIVVTGAALATYSLTLVSVVSQPHPLADRLRLLLRLTALASILIPLGLLMAPFALVHTILLSLLSVAFLAQALPPLTWGFLPGPLRPRAMPIIQLLILACATGTALLSTQLTISAESGLIARRVALVCCATAGIITMVYMTYIIERTRAASARRAIQAAEREAATSRALLEAEREYRRVQQLAAERTEQLSAVSHDLRQPLGSLRVTLDRLLQEKSEDIAQQAHQALAYLDELAGSFVSDRNVDSELAVNESEAIPVSLLLEALEQMFQSEAEAKHVRLRIAPCSLSVQAVPVPLMRILANLVANALKHADATKILLGARRRSGAVSILVADNGRGLRGKRCAASSNGTGHGLNIVQELSAEHGFRFEAFSSDGAGSTFSLTIPRA